jgi:hypothetical protein
MCKAQDRSYAIQPPYTVIHNRIRGKLACDGRLVTWDGWTATCLTIVTVYAHHNPAISMQG